MTQRSRRRERATGAQVAALAGVSTSVVSLVLNGKDAGRANPATRRRVLAAARDLGYRIDGRGRSLATGRTGIVGLIAPDITTPFFASLQTGLLAGLNPDFQLMTVVTDLGRAVNDESIEKLLSFSPDGLIVFALDRDSVASMNVRCPLLVLDSPGRRADFPRINLDVTSSAREIGRHLTGLGHRSLAYLAANTGSRSMEVRRRAVLSSFRRSAPRAAVTLARCAIDVDAARCAVRQAWPAWRSSGVTAVVCGSDLQAFGVIAALRDLGVAVPADVSVVGADDQPLSTLVEPGLTTVRLPSAQLGNLAGLRIRQIIDGTGPVRSLQVLGTELVVRESTGPAPRRPPR